MNNQIILSQEIKADLNRNDINIFDMISIHHKCLYDEQGSIGKRYYRQDEAGTAFGITIDHESLENDTVTIRERDSMKQHRISSDRILKFISENKI